MANPQQPELARSRKVPALDPDASATVLSAGGHPPPDQTEGPVPVDNLPGHHPEHEQDKPVERFVAKARALAAEAEAEVEPEADRPDADPSPLAQRVSGVATAPLRVAGQVLQGLRSRL